MSDQGTKKTRKRGQLEEGLVLHGRYEILHQLGAGGFAVVYAAFDQTIERQVALKVLNIQHMAGTDDETDHILERFLREAQVAARIRHPSIVEIYDFGVLEDEDQPYIIMEFLEGTDLEEEITDNGPVSADRLFPLFCGALDALGEAHSEGVIHKDLKPANLFLSEPGTRKEALKVVDFGIAHVNAPDKERMTKTGLMSGTPQYLPPEYIESQSVTPEMDIYQMGLILIEALSGEAVVQESSPYQAAFKHMHRDLIIPPELLQGELGQLLDKALAFKPEDRFGSAEEFSDALAAIDASTIPTITTGGTPQVASPLSPVADTDASKDWSQDALAGTLQGLAADQAQQKPSGSAPSVRLQGPMADQHAGGEAQRASIDSSVATEDPIFEEVQDSGHKVLIALLSAGSLVLLGVLVAIIVTYDSGEEDAQDPVADTPAEVAEEPAEEPEPEPAQPEEQEELAAEEPEDEPQLRVVELSSDPAGATVQFRDGTEVGETPLELELIDDEQLTLELSHSGYESTEVSIDDTIEKSLNVELERRPRPQPRPQPTVQAQPEPEPEPTEEEEEEAEEERRRQLRLAP